MKKNFLVALTILCVALLAPMILLGQGKAGTSAAPELVIPIGAKYVGMSGSGISSASGVDAIYWNPGGIDAGERGTSALFSYRKYIADIGVNYLAVAAKFEGFGALGLSLRSFNIGDIPVTTENNPDGTGEIISPTFFTMGISYSKQLSDRVSIGATANIVSESFGGVSSSGVAFDAGVQYQNLIGVNGLSLGVAVKNIGTPMQFGGSALWVQATDPSSNRGLTYYKVEAAKFQMPSVIDIGFGYSKSMGEDNSLELNASYENDNYGIDGYRVGGQYSFMRTLALRVGYQYSTDPSGTKSIFQNYTLGAGVNLQKLTGVGISVDYAYVPVQYFSANHLFDIRLDF